ncbi:hypothetical protein PFLG_00832 [Plasmodium falciparum RAJ116]|uniref:Uncharacterized protein n=1 Tax=Plasmodium falciparum RAJ116 TaxID=580058 RepID=A0A0L0CUC4_PLAFA|nr:hypothetical protein PFLG_00832 [Plasmodium falciparum RAJ116]
MCFHKYDLINKECKVKEYMKLFRSNRNIFDASRVKNDEDEYLKSEAINNNIDENNNMNIYNTSDYYETNKFGTNYLIPFDNKSSDYNKYDTDVSVSSISENSFILDECSSYDSKKDYIILEFIIEKIEEINIALIYTNILKNCYYIIKVEMLYNYIYNNIEILKRFAYLNNAYYLYKLYYNMFVWDNKNHFDGLKDINKKEKQKYMNGYNKDDMDGMSLKGYSNNYTKNNDIDDTSQNNDIDKNITK